MAPAPPKEATTKHDVVALIKDEGGVSRYPSDDDLVALLQGRFRSDLPYTRLGDSTLLVVNPLKTLANLNDASASSYAEKEFDAAQGGDKPDRSLQPHIYELAVRVYALASRRRENQSVVFSGLTGSGKTFSSERFVEQVLRLSAKSKAEKRIAERIKSVYNVLDSFGTAKSPANSSASRFGKFLELHLNDKDRIAGGKLFVFGLEKSRVTRLRQEERSYNVFYQLIAGADPDEREALNLDDPSSYALLASSGCYLLPGGPLSDDHAQMGELRASMANLGFKHRHLASIWSLLTAILLLGNIEFSDNGQYELSYESATVINVEVLDGAAHLLGLSAEDLQQALTNKTSFVRQELTSRFLNAADSARQRDALVRDIYSLLFAYIVDTINRHLEPESEEAHTIVSIFDQPGFQSRSPSGSMQFSDRAPLVTSANGQNSFEEFSINFASEVQHSSFVRRAFSDSHGFSAGLTADRVSLPSVMTMDNGACVDLLRGGPLGTKYDRKPGGVAGFLSKNCLKPSTRGTSDWDKDIQLLEGMADKFGTHASFIASPEVGLGPSWTGEKTLFGINHYSGSCSYDVRSFVERNTDVLDPSVVDLLQASNNAFISRLSSAGIATETHPNDDQAVVQAQIPITPLQHPTVTSSPFSDPSVVPEHLLAEGQIYPVTTQLNATLAELILNYEQSRTWDVLCIRPNDNALPNAFDKRRVKSQVRALLLPDLVVRRQREYVTSYAFGDFGERYGLGNEADATAVQEFAASRGWVEGADFTLGEERVWLSYSAWRSMDDELRARESRGAASEEEELEESAQDISYPGLAAPDQPWQVDNAAESQQNLVLQRTDTHGSGYFEPGQGQGYYQSDSKSVNKNGYASSWIEPDQWEDKALDHPSRGDRQDNDPSALVAKDLADGLVVNDKRPGVLEEKVEESRARKWWLRVVWTITWWIPNIALNKIGGMKRADIRLAWREKFAICTGIFFLCAIVIFYVVVFGKLLCPNFDKAWNASELSEHAQSNDFYVAVAGKVYDITNFWQGDHSDISSYPVTDDIMLQLAGTDLTGYFPVPFTVACPGLVTDESLTLQRNFSAVADYAVHWSGDLQTYGSKALADVDWYPNTFVPYMNDFYKGVYVYSKSDIQANADDGAKTWAYYEDGVYDLSDYLTTLKYYDTNTTTSKYDFLDDSLVSLFQNTPGKDITKGMTKAFAKMNETYASQQYTCLRNAFYVGQTDFRESARCTVNNYILLAFSVIIMVTIGAKFLAALQLSGKRNPEMLDKFVICQVPCYTEGEESLRTTIDSLAALNYDDKRKLMFIICDGNIYGSGNDKPTPRIVLDILGVDEKVEADPLMFKSVAEGSKQINYGKVYSGLYEFEGHVVPYMVVVKVGSPRERSKPGNRGKRDSQCLLLRYLNRVHFDAPMCPLELEMYHQMRNVIGIDPAFYEYLFQVDADTCVAPDSLNRMISCTIDDSAIIGICGETKLQNEMQSWTTMIQVYEYFMSHHLAKAFESLFGSVTCLPGCFSVYRLRTADKGRPIIISQRIIDDYSEPLVDTLHKKNLFSLGEDRYLTTLMMKYFPSYKMKFTPDALAYTVAPDRWSVLVSQRRRWINSTIHNLGELYFLPEMCGFCLFSMRFIVFLDLIGTIILPATCVYLFYLIITVAIGQAPIPIIALAMIGATYGLQIVIFLIKREFMLIGWMVIYILAYPVYSFFLPIYSFWSMDDFSWGNTRVVVGEGKDKVVQMPEDEYFDDSMIPLKKFSDYENEVWEKTSRQDSGSYAGSDYGSQREAPRPRTKVAPSIAGSGYNTPGGDYYRDGSPLRHHGSNPNLRSGAGSRMGSQYAGSQYGAPLPFGGGAPMMLPPMGFNAPPGSDYSQPLMPPHFPGMGAPRNTMMSLNSFAGTMPGPPSSYGGFGASPGLGGGLANHRMSTFSLATTANPFGSTSPSDSTDPTDDEILAELRHYISTSDLMTITKKSTRMAVIARFPKADLTSRIPWINSNIDQIMSMQ